MTKTTTDDTDLPKVMATILWTSPGLVLRTGASYLRMKSLARKSSDRFRASLVRSGMPPARANQLSESYGADLSLTRFFRGLKLGPDTDSEEEPPGK